jgi:hypothetical protein
MSDNNSPTAEQSIHPLNPEAAQRLAVRIAQAEQTQTCGEDWYFLHDPHDPIEDDPQITPLIKAAEKKAKIELRGTKVSMGWCHMFWGVKEWTSPVYAYS